MWVFFGLGTKRCTTRRPRGWIPPVTVGQKMGKWHDKFYLFRIEKDSWRGKEKSRENSTLPTLEQEQEWDRHNHDKNNSNAWEILEISWNTWHEIDLKDSSWRHWGARPACAQAQSHHPTSLRSASDKKCGNGAKPNEMQRTLQQDATSTACIILLRIAQCENVATLAPKKI